MSDHPPHAVMITFQPLGRQAIPYYFWETEGMWYWSALGNCGSADSEYEARAAAKDWISGQSPKKSG